MELTLKMDDGTIVTSEHFETESVSIDFLNGGCTKVNVSFLTNDTATINALYAIMHKE